MKWTKEISFATGMVLMIGSMVAILAWSMDEPGTRESRTKATNDWIKANEKPIIVTIHSFNGWNLDNRYTLISKDGKFYNTYAIPVTLPDTIK